VRLFYKPKELGNSKKMVNAGINTAEVITIDAAGMLGVQQRRVMPQDSVSLRGTLFKGGRDAKVAIVNFSDLFT
jgi:hypothetical protein